MKFNDNNSEKNRSFSLDHPHPHKKYYFYIIYQLPNHDFREIHEAFQYLTKKKENLRPEKKKRRKEEK